MANLFDLKQQRTALITASDSIIDTLKRENRVCTADEDKELTNNNAKIALLGHQIEDRQSMNTFGFSETGHFIPKGASGANTNGNGLSLAAPAPGRFGQSLAEAVRFAPAAEVEQVKTFAQYLGGNMAAITDLRPTADGGVFIPTIIAGVVARNYSAFSPVHDYANVWSTPYGEPASFPVISDSEDAVIIASAALTGADYVVTGDTPPTAITGPMMHAFKFSSKPVFIPRETMTDSNLDVMEEVLSAILSRITRTQNAKYTRGTGVNEPRGYLLDATPFSAGSVSLDLDVALDLAYSVPAMYRAGGVYMATDTTLKYLRKLKTGLSGDKRALWKDAFEEGNATLGTPATLHGYPIIVNNDMDSVATDGTFAGVSPLTFGDMKRFIVRDAEQGLPYVYRYPVPAKDGGAVIAFKRSDSRLVVPTAISKLTV